MYFIKNINTRLVSVSLKSHVVRGFSCTDREKLQGKSQTRRLQCKLITYFPMRKSRCTVPVSVKYHIQV